MTQINISSTVGIIILIAFLLGLLVLKQLSVRRFNRQFRINLDAGKYNTPDFRKRIARIWIIWLILVVGVILSLVLCVVNPSKVENGVFWVLFLMLIIVTFIRQELYRKG
ncbi:MAG: hypothetical protein WBW94_01815 [Anaerolineales bacterium]